MLQYGGAISVGIDQFKPSGAATCGAGGTVIPASVELIGSDISYNVASDSGGGIYVLSGLLSLTVSLLDPLSSWHA